MLRVLTYHRVGDPRAADFLNPRLISATPEAFERQMRHLASRYRVVSIEEVLHALEAGTRLPRRAVMLTFDDAYLDFGELAWPILKRYRLPAILFVPTAYPGQPAKAFWWDRLYRGVMNARQPSLQVSPHWRFSLLRREDRESSLRWLQDFFKTLPHSEAVAWVDSVCERLGEEPPGKPSVLSWHQLRELSKEGVAFGAHSRTHPLLTQLPLGEARNEMIGSREDLKREIGTALPVFAYPGGALNDPVVEVLRDAGFKIAFTTCDGQNDLHSADPLRLRRTNITPRTSLSIFRIRLMRVGSYLDMWRRRIQR